MDFIHKKRWLNTHGKLACYPSYKADIKDMVIWTSETGVLSMTGEGDDMHEAVDYLFQSVKEKLWRMSIIVEHRMT